MIDTYTYGKHPRLQRGIQSTVHSNFKLKSFVKYKPLNVTVMVFKCETNNINLTLNDFYLKCTLDSKVSP